MKIYKHTPEKEYDGFFSKKIFPSHTKGVAFDLRLCMKLMMKKARILKGILLAGEGRFQAK